MICTATDITVYTDISASAGTITASGMIPIVQDRINTICNNYFLNDLYVQGSVVFNATASTIVSTGDFLLAGFADGDEVYIYNSYRNEGYKVVSTVTATTLTLASSSSVVSELSGRSILISVVKWPVALKYIAAQMVKYDYDDRPSKSIGVTSRSLGPYSESFGSGSNVGAPTPFGYPQELIDALSQYTLARVS